MDKKKERIGQSIKIKKYDDIFDDGVKTENAAPSKDGDTVYVEPEVLRDFEGHPFKVAGKGIDELMDSIREHGILSPVIVRPAKGFFGGYEIISGHRRKYCASELGLQTVPVIIRDIDDDEAILAMVDSNIQREDILPSEKAFAYKMKLEAIKRQGERNDLTCGQVVDKLKSADIVGKESNESGRQIQRYIRLTELSDTLLGAVDSKKMSFNAGVELSFLREDEKKAVEGAATELKRLPTLRQAKKIRELSLKDEEISVESVVDILMEREKDEKARETVNFDREEIRNFFPEEYTARQIEEAVIEMLKERK